MQVRRPTTKAVSVLVAVLLTGGAALLGLSGPASAQTPVPTRVVMELSHKKAHYGDQVSIAGKVQGQRTDGSWAVVPYDAGTATLQLQPRGSTSWTTIQTDDSGYSFYFYPVKVTASGTYRVVYGGGSSSGFTFASSDASKGIKVYRDLHDKKQEKGDKFVVKGKVSPSWAKKKVLVERRTTEHGKWSRFKTLRTDGRSTYSLRLPLPPRGHRWYFKLSVQKSAHLEKSYSNYVYYTYRY